MGHTNPAYVYGVGISHYALKSKNQKKDIIPMRKKIFLNVLLTLALLLGISLNIPAAQDLPAKPVIKLSPELWDFGTIAQGEEVTHTFKVTNTGGVELIVDKVQTSCGCLVASISSKNVAPAKTAEIKVTLYSKEYKGEVKKYIYVRSNDPDATNKTIVIAGKIKALPKVTISPQPLILDPSAEQPRVFQFNIENKGRESLKISSLGTSSDLMKASVSSAEIKPGESVLVNVTLESKMDIEKIKENIHINIDIPISGSANTDKKDIKPVFSTIPHSR